MQAVLIAGGLGTRLRPLTFTRPKALIPLVNKPLVLHVIERLPADVDEVLIAANYRTEQLRGHIRRGLDNGVTKEEIGELITHLAFYGGWPTAVNAAQVAREVFQAP